VRISLEELLAGRSDVRKKDVGLTSVGTVVTGERAVLGRAYAEWLAKDGTAIAAAGPDSLTSYGTDRVQP
jgi:hypothetical protein